MDYQPPTRGERQGPRPIFQSSEAVALMEDHIAGCAFEVGHWTNMVLELVSRLAALLEAQKVLCFDKL